jgi:hypothetical protein
MVRRLGVCLVVLGALAVTPAAFAGYPTPMAQQGGLGVLTPDGSTRFVALAAGRNTVITKIATADGSVRKSRSIGDSFGIPVLVYGGAGEGLSRDGRFFVLQSTGVRLKTDLQIVSTRNLIAYDTISLNGSFAYDALSPDGKKLYLIQHSSVDDLQHYVVRAYDLDAHALLPGRIADKTQKSWVMQGFPAARTTSLDGRWVFTLYMNPGGYPFIHALDTVRGVAHCVGLPWASSNQGALSRVVLSLHDRTLAAHWTSGKPWLNVNTATWKISQARVSSSFSWLWLAVGLGAAAAALAAAALQLRRRRAGGALRVSPA